MYQGGEIVLEQFLTSQYFPDSESLRIESLGYPADACGPNAYYFVSQLSDLGPVPFLD